MKDNNYYKIMRNKIKELNPNLSVKVISIKLVDFIIINL